VPHIRPFRALRYEAESVGDLALVTSPPYDVIGPDDQRALLARHPRNVVRLDLPGEELGDEPDDKYRRAARVFAAWRSDGTFHKDPRPAIYAYEQTYRLPGVDAERIQRGYFARVRLEPFGEGGILPHERTLAAPREDRYRLLRATGANMSPVEMLYEDPSGRSAALLAAIVAAPGAGPVADVTDPDGVRHRLWVVPAVPAAAEEDDTPREAAAADPATELVGLAAAGPLTIADGHHRYETALRYRDERRMSRSCEEDPAFDYVLALLLESTGQTLTVLPTHRLVGGLGDGSADLLESVRPLFDDERVAGRDALEAAFGPANAANGHGGRGRFGLWTRSGGAILTARRAAFGPELPAGGAALRGLDVTLLQAALERLLGIDAAAIAAGRLTYTRSAREALDRVDAANGTDAAFLLDPTPVAAISAVARDGDVMPQKSTYFFPKPLSGLIINPHEW
jgi:uncharacterized protein (DUF1015 family)